MKGLELKIPPLVLVVITAAGMWVLSRISPNLYFTIPGVVWLSASLIMLGVCLVTLGVWKFRVAGTTLDPRTPGNSENLVIRGVYRHSRNPMYFGFFLVLSAWGFFLGSVYSLLFLPAFIIYMNRFQIVPEERAMHAKFGASYSEYKSRVRRWI